ncbi:NfeD family protein [Spirulina sp. CS-785/01]|uniref:NfeD family protein n=1 Tax=Spirulina sp. CS-785/01 TaxID=3021716 RepID=UPI00232CB26E|nr:NfeD family protein [Spirulina sp. CS-785/01]MDB9315557.1 NfeD family protein [Spirulina sp. CS-785/01]
MVALVFAVLLPLSLSPTMIWLIAAAVLCFSEFAVPTAFVAFMMGISALLVALVSLVVPQLSLQVILWLGLSVFLVILSRRFVNTSSRSSLLNEEPEGETLTEIPPGKTGRVLYEGNSWRAVCGDETSQIAPHQKVYIIGRKGNTLIVMPEYVVKGDIPPQF